MQFKASAERKNGDMRSFLLAEQIILGALRTDWSHLDAVLETYSTSRS